jgi:hypothetical protein
VRADPAKGVHARAVAADRIGDDIVKDLTIAGSTKQCLAVITAQHHMIEAAWNMYADKARHPCRSRVCGIRLSNYSTVLDGSMPEDSANVR